MQLSTSKIHLKASIVSKVITLYTFRTNHLIYVKSKVTIGWSSSSSTWNRGLERLEHIPERIWKGFLC